MLPDHVTTIIANKGRLVKVEEVTLLVDRYQRDLDLIAKLTQEYFKAPIALVSIIHESTQYLQSCINLNVQSTPVEHSFCAHAISEKELRPFVILDAKSDERFQNNPLVTGDPYIRFYAGYPILVDGERLGSLCVIDQKPWSTVSDAQLDRLKDFAGLASSVIRSGAYLHKIENHALLSAREMKRHDLAIKASNMATWVWDLKTGMVETDLGVRKFFDIQHDDPLTSNDIISRIHPDDRPAVEEQLERAIQSEEVEFNSEFRIASTGRWLVGRGAVLERDHDGNPVSIGGVNGDITEAKLARDKTKLLLRELNHRVKNTLAMLQSIANQTIKNAKSAEEFKVTFSGRLRGLAKAHTLLSDKEWEPVSIHQLIREQAQVYTSDFDRQIRISGDEATLSPEESVALGMVLHELATNAAKYGALSTKKGYVDINVKLDLTKTTAMAIIDWVERDGPAVSKPEKSGFGSIMIERSLDKIIGSSVKQQFLPGGVEVHIEVAIQT